MNFLTCSENLVAYIHENGEYRSAAEVVQHGAKQPDKVIPDALAETTKKHDVPPPTTAESGRYISIELFVSYWISSD